MQDMFGELPSSYDDWKLESDADSYEDDWQDQDQDWNDLKDYGPDYDDYVSPARRLLNLDLLS